MIEGGTFTQGGTVCYYMSDSGCFDWGMSYVGFAAGKIQERGRISLPWFSPQHYLNSVTLGVNSLP